VYTAFVQDIVNPLAFLGYRIIHHLYVMILALPCYYSEVSRGVGLIKKKKKKKKKQEKKKGKRKKEKLEDLSSFFSFPETWRTCKQIFKILKT